ncbi:MAG: acylphosphatase [Armatimonadetes bacterium]|nr:MAG: acylphosphatase [Armatimonadota bacterium]
MQAHIYIMGFVQGVGYRSFVRSKAREYELMGWVKNLPDGRVEVVAQSFEANVSQGKEKLIKFIDDLKRGPFLAEVSDVVVKWEDSSVPGEPELKSYTDFIIIK